ncbi:hypothetical protein MAH1_11450 [Sessilibacter sp. MAH1]
MDGRIVKEDNIIEQIWSICDRHPNQEALKCENGKFWNYQSFQKITYKIANGVSSCLSQESIRTGDQSNDTTVIIALLIDHTPELIFAIIGTLAAGCAYFPIDTRSPESQIDNLLRINKPVLLITDSNNSYKTELLQQTIAIINIDELIHFEDSTKPALNISPNNPTYLLSTSGSTGVPKGVLHTHQSLLRSVNHYINDFGVLTSDTIGLIQACTYTPSIFSIFGALKSGACLCIFNVHKNSSQAFYEWLQNHKISLLYTTPSSFRKILSETNDTSIFKSLRCVQLAGEPLLKSDIELWQKDYATLFALYNGFGSTETSCISRQFVSEHTLEGQNISVGEPYSDVTIKIINDQGQELASNEVGEIIILSAYTAHGYWQQPEISTSNFFYREDSNVIEYRSGDLGYIDQNGALYILGRQDRQVKIRGQRVELRQIEQAILSQPEVKECAVELFTPDNEEPYLAAFIIPEELDLKPIREYLSNHLQPFMIPTRWAFLDSLPQNSAGKIDHTKLKEYNFKKSSSKPGEGEPENSYQKRAIEAFTEILKDDDIDLDSDFFDHGGTSLNAVDLAMVLSNKFAVPFNASSLIEASTPRDIAYAIENMHKADSKTLIQFKRLEKNNNAEDNIPLFCIPGMFGNALSFRALASEMLKYRNVFAFEYPGYSGGPITFANLPELVDLLFTEITKKHPHGKIALACYSLGGCIGFELYRKLLAHHREVVTIIFLDCFAPRGIKLRHIKEQCKNLLLKITGRQTTGWRAREEKVNLALTRSIANYKFKPQTIRDFLFLTAELKSTGLLGIAKNAARKFFDIRPWQNLFTTPITHRFIQGNHIDIIMPEKAKAITDDINQYMAAFDPISIDELNTSDHALLSFSDALSGFQLSSSDTQIVKSSDIPNPYNAFIATESQLTANLEKALEKKLTPKVHNSKHEGAYYTRKVDLIIEGTKNIAVKALITVNLSDKRQDFKAQIINGDKPFGTILQEQNIIYSCEPLYLFAIGNTNRLKSLFNLNEVTKNTKAYGRINQFKDENENILATVIEILSPQLDHFIKAPKSGA